MNKRLKKELRGEWREGRDRARAKERDGERERGGEREKEKRKTRRGTKSLTDVAHVGATCKRCVHSEKVSLSLFSLPLPAQLPTPRAPQSQYTSRRKAVAMVQGKDAIMSGRQRSISPWLFIGLPERWTLCYERIHQYILSLLLSLSLSRSVSLFHYLSLPSAIFDRQGESEMSKSCWKILCNTELTGSGVG